MTTTHRTDALPAGPEGALHAGTPRARKRAAADPNAHAFTIRDAQAMGAPGTTTIYSLFKSGRLRKIKVGGRTLIEGDSLRALLSA